MNRKKPHSTVKTSRIAAIMMLSFLIFISSAWICADNLLNITARTHLSSNSETIIVPDLSGLMLMEADGGEGFTVILDGECTSESPRGSIVSQSPTAGVKRKKKEHPHVIRVTISAGKEIPSVPDVKSMDVRDAKILLENTGFKASVKYAEHNFGSYDKEIVLDCSPRTGEKAKYGSEITLYVKKSREAKSVVCPDICGMYLPDAISSLRSHGLKAGNIEHSDGAYFESTVKSQGRAAGSYIPIGCAVDIVLAPQIVENEGENINEELFFKQNIEKYNEFWRQKSFRWHTTRQEE